MARHKYTNIICGLIIVVMLIATCGFMAGEHWGLAKAHADPLYAKKLFSTDRVQTVEIMTEQNDWDNMIQNARDEKYITATVIINGEKIGNVGIRPKGNSTLGNPIIPGTRNEAENAVLSEDMLGASRYSFKIEFDHYVAGRNYYGLDKLALNNIAQDSTYLKDYLSYQMMNYMDADAPLSSFAYISVNGEDLGLYLAVECIEESFSKRRYGADYGQIYKPEIDMMGMMIEQTSPDTEDKNTSNMTVEPSYDASQTVKNNQEVNIIGAGNGFTIAKDAALIYTDDNFDSYKNIFDNAAFSPTATDKNRLISALKKLNEGDAISSVNMEEVIRYFVVHNFVLNSDGYTGPLLHNYYLHEKNGKLSMVAWDYNLAFGGVSGIMGHDGKIISTTSLANYPIDSPMFDGTLESRPMVSWIFEDEKHLSVYHDLFKQFIAGYFETGAFESMIDGTIALISPYVEKDPTAFYTYEEFLEASSTLKEFCLLRSKSIAGQLEGIIPTTLEEQAADDKNFVDASHIIMNFTGNNFLGGTLLPSDWNSPEDNSEQFYTHDGSDISDDNSVPNPTPSLPDKKEGGFITPGERIPTDLPDIPTPDNEQNENTSNLSF